MSLGTQEEMPEPEADAEPDTGDSHSGGTISDVDEESDSDMDRRPGETAKAKRIAPVSYTHLTLPTIYSV